MTASPTPFFAESANKSEHHADSAYCSDAQVGLPSEDEIRRIVDDALNSAIPEPWEVSTHATQRILDLIRPAFEAKVREIAATHDAYQQASVDAVSLFHEAEARALSAEAKLAQAVEALEPFAKLAEAFDKAAEKFGRPLRPDGYIPSVQVSYGDLRRARAAARGEKT